MCEAIEHGSEREKYIITLMLREKPVANWSIAFENTRIFMVGMMADQALYFMRWDMTGWMDGHESCRYGNAGYLIPSSSFELCCADTVLLSRYF